MSPLGNAVPVSCCGKVLPLDLVRRIISGRELMTYAKFMIKYSDATTPRTVGTKRKAAPEKQPAVVSQKAKGKPPAKRAKKGCIEADGSSRECIACSSPNKLRVGPCGHGYCQPCLKKMAKTSLSNRNQVPVRCCSKELPIEYVESVLTKNQFQQYQRYVSERDPKKSTLKSDRDYAAIVRKNKGKQCPVCGIGVVKVSGCHAMRCSLGHGFCWNCLQSICTCGRIYQYN
ncbi:Inorganic pyrophosphatase 3 [Phytophthora cinnamomi]|uniref:Inorganic pyrophosphatase 3 n=1 Tax=Phytophthora cinnamomi TaxID=4785 RepID=UPI003559E372|nr:Inorganic pyrophosphatase 3 [Phytophthora cinnamomi]